MADTSKNISPQPFYSLIVSRGAGNKAAPIIYPLLLAPLHHTSEHFPHLCQREF